MDNGRVVTSGQPGIYGFDTQLQGEFNAVVQRVIDALKTEGFGVLADIDVQATMKAKLGVEGKPYRILGACNPALAQQAIAADPNIGLLLPCNVVVREDSPRAITVSFMDPVAVLALVNNPVVTKLGWEVKGRLERVRDQLKTSH